jgi:hypothetical protein
MVGFEGTRRSQEVRHAVRAHPQRSHLCTLLVLALAVACATTSTSKLQTTSSGPEQRFSMVGSGFQTSALISKAGAQGPQIDVGRYDDGKTIRGKVDGKVIDMTVTGTHAQGILGPGRSTSTWTSRVISSR